MLFSHKKELLHQFVAYISTVSINSSVLKHNFTATKYQNKINWRNQTADFRQQIKYRLVDWCQRLWCSWMLNENRIFRDRLAKLLFHDKCLLN